MSKSEMLFQIAIYIIPAIIFFGAVYYITNKWVEVQREKMKLNFIDKKGQGTNSTPNNDLNKQFLPMQVDAYQRMVLFLERISPNNMVMRLNNPGLPARAFQQKLLENIRQEYEHNLAQQIFISSDAWSKVQASKEEVLKIINMAATKLEGTALANDLSKGIFEITAQLKSQPTDQAIAFLKDELNQKFKG
ncbi:DUF7935 family protein [Crocinitomix algicola]|uniref:DUF7935 family protein n=1 Tax=Crocinitomix algicola TaxID=1740263 RepID=UPI000830C087|nr:hypothetical protein [Crocinitomix algicola]